MIGLVCDVSIVMTLLGGCFDKVSPLHKEVHSPDPLY